MSVLLSGYLAWRRDLTAKETTEAHLLLLEIVRLLWVREGRETGRHGRGQRPRVNCGPSIRGAGWGAGRGSERTMFLSTGDPVI